jgi:hypothetical protein
MTTTTPPTTTATFADVLAGARMLTPTERARLIALLAEELATPIPHPPTPPAAGNDAWERLNQFRTEIAALGPRTRTLAEQLDQDRRERDAMLMGRTDTYDAHT